jgi:hypothetical protein
MDSTGVRFLWANIRVGKFPGFYRRWEGMDINYGGGCYGGSHVLYAFHVIYHVTSALEPVA